LTRIKICGIREVEHALAAAENGADFIGMVFAPSRRRITPEKARLIAAELKALPDPPRIVGVFANAVASEVNGIAEYCKLDRVQLSGTEPWQYCREIRLPVIKVIHVSNRKTSLKIEEDIAAGLKLCPDKDIIFLLDTASAGAFGGTGKTFDWGIAREIAARHRIIVAGGLDPENVSRLIREVSPWGVDVSSGVESHARKDAARIKAFLLAARSGSV